MDTLTLTFVLILLAVGVLLVIEVSPHYSRRDYSRKIRDAESDRDAQREQLRELHRMRRQRDRIWFRMDDLYAEFAQKASIEKPTLEFQSMASPPHVSDSGADNWNDVTHTYLKEKYESFLKKD
jgi:hypothetical protein